MLTQTQISNLHKLDKETSLQVLHECVERLGVMSVEEYSNTFNIPKRTVYDHLEAGKLGKLIISGKVFVLVNW